MSAIPNRRQPAFKNGVKKQKLHNKNILILEEIFKTGPKMPQQMSRTSPTTPSGWLSMELGLAAVWFPLSGLYPITENEWDFPGLPAGQGSESSCPAGRCAPASARVLLVSQLPGHSLAQANRPCLPWEQVGPCQSQDPGLPLPQERVPEARSSPGWRWWDKFVSSMC